MSDLEFTFRGKVTGGQLTLENKDVFIYHLLDFEGQDVAIKVRKWRNPRSIEQNSYYWGVVIKMIAEAVGYREPDEAHQEMAKMFLTYKGENGRKYIRSTASLDTKEFTVYLDQVLDFAAEFLYLEIPLPTKDPWWKTLMAVKRLQTPDGWKFDNAIFEREPIDFKVDKGLDKEA